MHGSNLIRLAFATILIELLIITNCSENKPTGPYDEIPPASITDLTVIDTTPNSITLAWTAPGDDENEGTATRYDIRYSNLTITDDDWVSALRIHKEPKPKTADEQETFECTGLFPNSAYYFAMKTADEVFNWSVTCPTF